MGSSSDNAAITQSNARGEDKDEEDVEEKGM